MARDFAKAFYNSKAWHDCRDAYASSVDYLCEECSDPGEIVHHEERLTPENINDPNVTLNWKKLKLLCIRCHNKVYEEKAIATGLKFDDEGNLIESPRGS